MEQRRLLLALWLFGTAVGLGFGQNNDEQPVQTNRAELFELRHSDGIRDVLLRLDQIVRGGRRAPQVTIHTTGGRFTGELAQITSRFAVLQVWTGRTNLTSGDRVYEYHYIVLTAITAVSLETERP